MVNVIRSLRVSSRCLKFCVTVAALHKHIASNSIDYLQFSFRWFNNILRRELPLRCVIRLWDTYQSEVNGFGNFHLYVCAAFLIHFSKELKAKKDFQVCL